MSESKMFFAKLHFLFVSLHSADPVKTGAPAEGNPQGDVTGIFGSETGDGVMQSPSSARISFALFLLAADRDTGGAGHWKR